MDGGFHEAVACDPDEPHSALGSQQQGGGGGGGSCVSSDRRQLTGSLTSAFGKLNVISEAEEDVSRFTPPHYSCALFLLAPPPPARRLVPQSSVSFWNMDLLPWTPCVSLNVSRT